MADQDPKRLAEAFRQEMYDSIHELKSPLVSIRGFTEILIERAADRLSEAELGYLERITKNVDRLSDLLESIRLAGQAMAETAEKPPAKK